MEEICRGKHRSSSGFAADTGVFHVVTFESEVRQEKTFPVLPNPE